MWGSVLLGVALSSTAAAQSADGDVPSTDPAVQPAEVLPRASRALLLEAFHGEAGYIAVGERGHILVSDDAEHWQQREVPTRSTLTAVTGVADQVWAAGHDGVILHSGDGGKTWERRRLSVWTPDISDPSEGVPVLDLLFTDAENGFAIGAYSLLLRTHDGGKSWEPTHAAGALTGSAAGEESEAAEADAGWGFSDDDLALGAESDPHFNAIARTDAGDLVIAGERGTFLRSRDGGETWESRRLPYEGSMFGVLAWEGEHILVFGLRGNVYESRDLGQSWDKVETGITTSLMGGHALPGGGAILVGTNGAVLWRKTGDNPFVAASHAMASGETPLLAGVIPLDDGRFLLIGDKGADLYRPE